MEKIALYKKGIDPTEELGNEAVKKTSIEFTYDATRLKGASFIIVAVPTPINGDKTPNLEPVISACRIVGQQMSRGIIVCFESTVYPGVTEDVCVPILEKESGLKCGIDFKVAYSPERINPGDKIHRLANITKIVSGMDEETLNTVAQVYGMPEGYEMKVNIQAKYVRTFTDRGKDAYYCGVEFKEPLAEYLNRRRGRYMLAIAAILLFIITAIIMLMRTESIIYYKFNKVLYTYSIITAAFLLTRYFFGSLYRPAKIDKNFTPGVTIIIP